MVMARSIELSERYELDTTAADSGRQSLAGCAVATAGGKARDGAVYPR